MRISRLAPWSRIPLLAASLLAAGCPSGFARRPSIPDPPHLTRADEAGTASVAVLSVGRWEDYQDALQPTYALTEKQALDAVVATTKELEERFIDALKLGVSVGLEQTSTTETVTATEEDGETSREAKSETKREPGEVPDTSPIEAAAKDLGPEKSGLKGAVGIDSMSQHWAATALYQEVQLLNRYIEDAQQRGGYRPYVIRLQVSLLPKARNLPYDAYSTFSFFGGRDWSTAEIEAGGASGRQLGEPTPAETEAMATVQQLENKIRSGALPPYLKSALGLPDPRVVVVPLLVTDNLEATLHSQTIDIVRQFALAIGFLKAGDAGGVDFARSLESLNSALGRDLNSLLTVARLNDSTVRVRLGALQQVAITHAMVPRTHNISFLLLVPCEVSCSHERLTHLVHRTDFVHIFNGKRLEPMEEDMLRKRLMRVADDFDIDKSCEPDEMEDLYKYAVGNRWGDFRSTLLDCSTAGSRPFFRLQPLWLAMLDLAAQTQHGTAEFELPQPVDRRGFTARQNVLLLDDATKDNATVTLTGGLGLRGRHLEGLLELENAAGQKIQLTAHKVEPVREGRDFRFSFVSPKAWGFEPKPMTGKLTVTYEKAPRNLYCEKVDTGTCKEGGQVDACDDKNLAKCPTDFAPVLYRKKSGSPAVKANFEMTATPGTVTQTKGVGGPVRVHVKLSKKDKPDKVFLRVANAAVKTIRGTRPDNGQPCGPGISNPDLARWELTTDCNVTFVELASLVPGASVVLSASSEKADAAAPGGKRKYDHPPVVIRVL